MRQTISISNGFFCDRHCYLLTSSSFGGSYVIRLKPLESEPRLPETESGWFEKFEFRDAPDFNN